MKPAWPAATFIQPASVEEARRLAARNESQPFLGHRTVVIENGQLVEPGVLPIQEWRPDVSPAEPLEDVNTFGGIGRKK